MVCCPTGQVPVPNLGCQPNYLGIQCTYPLVSYNGQCCDSVPASGGGASPIPGVRTCGPGEMPSWTNPCIPSGIPPVPGGTIPGGTIPGGTIPTPPIAPPVSPPSVPPEPGGTTPGVTPATAPPGGTTPIVGKCDKGWWACQPDSTKLLVVGGAAIAGLGLLLLLTKKKGSKAYGSQASGAYAPNRKRRRRKARKHYNCNAKKAAKKSTRKARRQTRARKVLGTTGFLMLRQGPGLFKSRRPKRRHAKKGARRRRA